jgi:hypothetical protein
MDIKRFYSGYEIQHVDVCYLPEGEQRVTMNRRYGGTMVLRQGVLLRHVWVYWSQNSDKRREMSMIPYDVDHWNAFFKVASDAIDRRSPPDIVITPPKRKIFGIA